MWRAWASARTGAATAWARPHGRPGAGGAPGDDLGALGASDEAAAFYAARGWQLWRGRSCAFTPDGVRRTPDEDGCIYVFPGSARLDLDADLTCDWREGDVW